VLRLAHDARTSKRASVQIGGALSRPPARIVGEATPVPMKFEPVPGRGALMEERVERTRIEGDYDEKFHHRREPRDPWRDRSRFARLCEDREPPVGQH